MTSRQACALWLGVLVLLLAAAARIIAFGESPPGMQHDEMFKAIEGLAAWNSGDWRVFYPSNQGHEGSYVWFSAVSQALMGDNLLGVRFPAMVFGMLAVALTFRAVSAAVGLRAGFVAAGLVAVSFWGAFVGRVGLRASMLPAFVVWVGWGLWRLSQPRLPLNPYRVAALTGVALGASLYTYTSALALLGGAGMMGIGLLFFDCRNLRHRWRIWAVFGVTAAVICAPMVYARLTDREGFNRVSTINRPLTDALAGQPQELLDNAIGLAGMFAFTGDPEARYGIPGRAMFGGVGLLVYVGAVLMLGRVRRQPVWAYWLGVGALGLVPSLLTVSAPSMLRSVAVLPVAAVCVGLCVQRLTGRTGWVAAVTIVGVTGILDMRALWVDWPRLSEVQAIYRDDLEQLARYTSSNGIGRALVSTPEVALDSQMYPFMGGDASKVSFFDGDTSVVFAQDAVLFVSPFSPLTPPHRPLLEDAAVVRLPDVMRQDGRVAYEVYQLDAVPALSPSSEVVYLWGGDAFLMGELADWAEPLTFPVNFGGVVELVGVELADREIAPRFDGVNLQVYLRPLVARQPLTLQTFAHVYRQRSGALHAQRDLLGVPPVQWSEDMTIIQDTFVVMGDSRSGLYVVAFGVYDYVTGQRLPVLGADGRVLGDRVLLGRVRVSE